MTHPDPAFVVPILILYPIFALQVWWFGRGTANSAGKRAIWSLVAVFVLCDMSGYLTDLIEMPRWVNNGLHLLLIGATSYLVLTAQAKHIARMFDDA